MRTQIYEIPLGPALPSRKVQNGRGKSHIIESHE
jgi:hypothetical protein